MTSNKTQYILLQYNTHFNTQKSNKIKCIYKYPEYKIYCHTIHNTQTNVHCTVPIYIYINTLSVIMYRFEFEYLNKPKLLLL